MALRKSNFLEWMRSVAGDRPMALLVLCLGILLVSIDASVVVVALPSIKDDLHLSDTGVVWVVNSYIATYGGMLLLSGRVGDLFGHRKVFLIGTGVFTVASVGCALARGSWLLISWRVLQGFGGAAIGTTALALIMRTYSDAVQRTRVLGVYGFVGSGGSVLGLVMGGVLTDALGWRWIFLVNLPIGAAVCAIAGGALRDVDEGRQHVAADVLGGIAVTASLISAILAIEEVRSSGWRSLQTLTLFGGAGLLFMLFLVIEASVREPLVPLRVFQIPNLVIGCIANVLTSVVGSAVVFVSLYLQLILHYKPLQVALSFIPGTVAMGVLSIGISARLVMRFGVKRPLVFGIALASLGLVLLGQVRVDGSAISDAIPGMLLTGLGIGIACNPMLLATIGEAPQEEVGLVSGIVASSSIMGSAFGLASLATLSARYTEGWLTLGADASVALDHGYQSVFLIAALLNIAAVPCVLYMRRTNSHNLSQGT